MTENRLLTATSDGFRDRTRAPLVGVIVVVTLAAGLAVWTVRRVAVAEAARERVERSRAQHPARAIAPLDTAPNMNDVKVARPEKTQWSPHLELEGTLMPQQAVSLSFSVPGKVVWVRAKVGDQVEAGAGLAGLDTSQADGEAAAVAASVLAASMQLDLANDSASRSRTLVATGSQSAMGATQNALQASMASAQLDAARAKHALAQVSLRNHILRAPFSGTVVAAPEGVGGVVGPGQTLFRLVDLKKLVLEATVGDADANLLRVGERVVIDSERGRVEGRIGAILPALEERTRRVPVRAEFANGGVLRSGALVMARVETTRALDVLRLPHDTLLPGSQDEVVVVLPGPPATLALRRIAYVTEAGGDLLVRSGISPDDVVLVAPEPDVKTGDPLPSARATESAR